MALELQLIKHHSGILIPATPETSDILQSKTRLGDVLVAEFRRVRNPAFHRRFFALINLGFEYWEPTGGAISSNERKLITGYAKFLATYGGNEGALIDAAEQYLEQVAYRRVTNGISLCKSFDAYRSWVIVEAGHFDAIQLASFCPYNIGPGKCFPSTFYKRINAGDRRGACEAIRWWIKDGGRDCSMTKGQKNGCYGQVERRDQESALACWGIDQ